MYNNRQINPSNGIQLQNTFGYSTPEYNTTSYMIL